MGKEEPSSHAASDKPGDNSVFVNGALAVPGAPANTDTVPAKFSEKNANDDKLITLAYTFKLLTDEQRRAIYETAGARLANMFKRAAGQSHPPHRRGGWRGRRSNTNAGLSIPVRCCARSADYRQLRLKAPIWRVPTGGHGSRNPL